MMTKILINDTSGKSAMLTGSSGTPIDFGSRCREMVEHLLRATPPQNMLAGMGRRKKFY
jgi:hypothetical protein